MHTIKQKITENYFMLDDFKYPCLAWMNQHNPTKLQQMIEVGGYLNYDLYFGPTLFPSEDEDFQRFGDFPTALKIFNQMLDELFSESDNYYIRMMGEVVDWLYAENLLVDDPYQEIIEVDRKSFVGWRFSKELAHYV
jgi:hypothetical protein